MDVLDMEATHHALGVAQVSPWELRSRGLTEKLSDRDFAVVLIHIAKHRGFRSNSKSENKADDAGKVKDALRELELRLAESSMILMDSLSPASPRVERCFNL